MGFSIFFIFKQYQEKFRSAISGRTTCFFQPCIYNSSQKLASVLKCKYYDKLPLLELLFGLELCLLSLHRVLQILGHNFFQGDVTNCVTCGHQMIVVVDLQISNYLELEDRRYE
jgi:hypothetical protein